MPISAMLTQPVICASRMAMAPEAATSPGVAAPRCHIATAPPTSTTGRMPETTVSDSRNQVFRRPKSMARSRKVSIAPRAAWSSYSALANSLTVLMLVIVSTTWPVIMARALARPLDCARTRGRKKRISAR